MTLLMWLLGVLSGICIVVLTLTLQKKKQRGTKEKLEQEIKSYADQKHEEAKSEKEKIIREARERARRVRNEAERENRKAKSTLRQQEQELLKKAEQLNGKEKELKREKQALLEKERWLSNKEEKLSEEHNALKDKLQTVANLSQTEARKIIMQEIEKELALEKAKRIRRAEEEIRRDAEMKAKEIVTLAVQKCAIDTVAEATVSVVMLPSDDMKGRLIGKEGRNIRTFEMLTGIDLIVDDTPEAVVVSCFDPLRREIARSALEKLIADGRIHPARIEEMVEKAKLEIEKKMIEEGENAALQMGIADMHPELIRLLGKLHFRTSYGQNVLRSCIEAATLSGHLAAEIGIDDELAKRSAFLHDIGKAVSHEIQGPHALIGAELAAKYNEPKGVVHAIAAHHGDVEPQTAEAVIVQVADAISAARPGARKDSLENYVQRMRHLEEIAESFEGVEKCYAIQAGREIRVMVSPDHLDDTESTLLAREVAKKIEQEHQYPGQIKVTVIRETRSVEYAR